VYSYAADEDDMVTDPLLDKHLRHWGINMLQVGLQRGRGLSLYALCGGGFRRKGVRVCVRVLQEYGAVKRCADQGG
jgi:hypothetical protein